MVYEYIFGRMLPNYTGQALSQKEYFGSLELKGVPVSTNILPCLHTAV